MVGGNGLGETRPPLVVAAWFDGGQRTCERELVCGAGDEVSVSRLESYRNAA